MGKHVGMKHSGDKQAGCMWGLVHNWHSHVRKMIHYHKHDDGDWSPETKIYENDAYETDKHHSTKRSRATKKRSLRARLKAMIADEISKEDKNTKKLKNLQRTYSIHHLESVDDDVLSGKTSKKWKHPIIFLPKDGDNTSSQSLETKASSNVEESSNDPDVFEIFKVDKELLLKHLQDSEKSIASFSRFSKSRSYPAGELANGRKIKPVKLESKQTEVWSNKLPSKEGDDGSRKLRHQRSSSLNESLDKYARLFEHTSGKYTKLNSSRSLKLTNEYGIAPLYFTRMHSLSYVDSYYSDLNLEVLVDNPSATASVASAQIKEDSQIHDQSSVLDDESRAVEPQIYEGLEHGAGADELNDVEASKVVENDEMSIKIANSELDYVRNLLEQSGIALDASEIAWYSSDQLLGPQLFEEVEACWPHARGELTGCPDFYGCWHHQMLFDLVNEVLLEVYDLSLPYYPKPLSSSCHVRSFPIGDHIIEEVCRSVGALVDMKDEEKESLDGIVGRDLDFDRRWMNLQLESEFVGLDVEEMIFDELLQEVVCLS